MRLKLLLPSGIVLEADVTKVIAEAVQGCFCILPRHIDLATALVPGLFAFETASGTHELMALDAGTIVKRGPEVLVAVRRAVRSPDRGLLHQVLRTQRTTIDEKERMARTAAARLETEVIRRFLAFREEH